jgi:GntR family transcriptional regulator, transcriptional repressor for pyruvate dehydrogenase complex
MKKLESLIFGELRPGEHMPSEVALADALGVSRLTVREATRALEARGLLEIRRGRRPIVAAPNGAVVGDFFKTAILRDSGAVLELLEVRMALETYIAGLAARRATTAAIAQLEAAVAAMRAAEDDPVAFTDADVRFHANLAASTGNRLLSWLIEALAEPLRESRVKSTAGHLTRGRSVAPVVAQHEEILEAVKRRQAKAAAAAMTNHLRETEKDLRAVLRAAPGSASASSTIGDADSGRP